MRLVHANRLRHMPFGQRLLPLGGELSFSSKVDTLDIPSGIISERCVILGAMKTKAKRRAAKVSDKRDWQNAPWIRAIIRLLNEPVLRPDPRNPSKTKRWRQGDLASASQVMPNTISDILLGKRPPDIGTLTRIGEAFNVPLWVFFVTERQAELLFKQQAQEEQLVTPARIRQMQEKIAEINAMFHEFAGAGTVPAPASHKQSA